MAAPKKLVLFVEGPGDQAAAPVLVKKLLTEIGGWDALRLGNDLPWKVGGVESVTKGNGAEWQQKLRAVQKQKDLGAVLLLLDGDHEIVAHTHRTRRQPEVVAHEARIPNPAMPQSWVETGRGGFRWHPEAAQSQGNVERPSGIAET